MSDIKIVCGDPAKEPASFTRFVLPFAYKLEKCEPVTDRLPFYQPVDDVWKSCDEKQDFVWRRRYLTDETEEVLFRRAKWFELSGWNAKNFQHSFAILKPPRLILFEFQLPVTEKQAVPELMQSGFLIIEANFKTSQPDNKSCDFNMKFDDFMRFNELFRYWQKPFHGHEAKGYKEYLASLPVNLVVGGIKIDDATEDDDIYFARWSPFLLLPVRPEKNGDYYRIIPVTWHENALERIRGGYEKSRPDWLVHADNRAFVWTCALLQENYSDKTCYGADVLNREFGRPFDQMKAADFGYWTKLLNVDAPDDNSSRAFEKEWTERHTYKRWEERGTFYGYTPHSAAMLGAPLNEKSEPFGTPIWRHFGGMYFDQTLLLLYLKTTLFRFSLKLHAITVEAMESGEDTKTKWLRAFQKLRWDFTRFTNLYQFPMLSNQQQGLEMYTLQRKCMDIDDLFAEIKEEIHSSYEFLMVQQDREQTEQGARLNVVATMGIVGALAFGFLGINILVGENKASWHDPQQWMIVLFVVFVFWCITKLIIFYSSGLSRFFVKLAKCGQAESETVCKILKGGK